MRLAMRKWALIVGASGLLFLLGAMLDTAAVRAEPQKRLADLPVVTFVQDTRGFTEPWIVLSQDHFGTDRTLLVLKGLHSGGNRPYYTSSNYVYGTSKWGNSDIRLWLRGDFYGSLSDRFRAAVRETTTVTYGDALTDETIFLLSAAEWGYTDTYYMKLNHGTAVAGAGSYRTLGQNYWTRSPSYDNSPSLLMVKPNGDIEYRYYAGVSYGVRPSANLDKNARVYGPYTGPGGQFYTLFTADPAVVLVRMQHYSANGAGELTMEELDAMDAAPAYAVNLEAYKAAIEGAGTIGSASRVRQLVTDVNAGQRATWVAAIANYAAAGDAGSLTIEELLAAGMDRVKTEELPRYRAVVAGAGAIGDAAELQELVDQANGQALQELFDRIRQYAASGNADELTMEELLTVGAVRTIALHLAIYKAAIAEAGTIADLAELQRMIDRSNALTIIRDYTANRNAGPLTIAELENAGTTEAVAANLAAYRWALVHAAAVSSPGALQQLVDRANVEQTRARRLVPQPIAALPAGTVVKETKGFGEPWIVHAQGHFRAGLTLLTLKGVHPSGGRAFHSSFDYDLSNWENSDLRTWLRNGFYNSLSERFRSAIETTTTKTYGQTLTDETVFLLSVAEWGYADTYDMYKDHGTLVPGSENYRTINADYWTRSPSYDNSPSIFYVKKNGTFSYKYFDSTAQSVRPSVNIGSNREVYGPYYDAGGAEYYTLFAGEPGPALAKIRSYAAGEDVGELAYADLISAGIEGAVDDYLHGYREAIAQVGVIQDLAALQQVIDGVNAEKSAVKTVEAFRFDGLTPPAIGIVDETEKTISVSVPYGTNVKALMPTIAYTGASVTPAPGEARDFTGPVIYTVTAADGSEQSYTANVTIRPVDSADAPVLMAAEPGDGQVSLTWSPAAGATDYRIYWRTGEGSYAAPAYTVTGAVYGYTATGLTNGTAYSFVVQASYAGVDSELSNELVAVPRTVPGVPRGVVATAGDGRADVSFEAPASNGGSPIVRYEVADAAGRMVAAGAGSPIAVTGLENGTAYAFTVTAVNVAGPGLPSALSNEVTPRAASNGGNPGGGEGGGNGGNGGNVGGGGGGGSSAPQTPAESKENPAASVQVWVNGQVASLGATAKERLGDREATLLVVDSVLLERVLSASEGANATLKVAGRSAGGLVVALDAQALRMLQQRHATVELDIGTGIYPVPVEAIDLADVMRRLGGAAVQTGFSLRIEAFLPAEAAQERLAKTAAAERLELRGSPVEFAIRAVQGAKSVPISRFNGYVERLIALPDGAAGAGISTGVVMDDNGNLRHAPTKLIKRDGKQYARISSLTNSVYALVSRPVHFSDMAGHWAEEDIAEMSARLVINGEKGTFGPDRPVTRAEFAAMLVRALGLPQAEGTTIPFADVNPGVWYADTVHTAYVYGMIGGFEDGTFRPTARMTREQALVMIARAMSLTGLKTDVATGTKASLPFADAAEVSAYARSGVAAATQAGIASGAKDGRLAPKAQITRAEVAALLKRLLEKSDLI